jgi:para-nitrobenzyl esterase
LSSPTGRHLFGDRPKPEASAVSRELQQAWARFATTGDPGWPAYGPEQRLTRVLDVESKTLPYPEEASHQIWRRHPRPPFDRT